MGEESFVYTACPGWGDHEHCALKTIVRDGKIVRTEKIEYTGPEKEYGYICQKGVMSCRQPYNEDRLLYPMKRAGKRGEGKWERITWEQALDEIAEKLIAIKDEYGSAAVTHWHLPAAVPPHLGITGMLATRWNNCFGAVDPVAGVGYDNGPSYATWFQFANPMMQLVDPARFHNTELLIIWGCNPIENQQRVANAIVEAQSRGAYIVDIGLIFDGSAGKADWFVPCKPGTDAALALGMARYLIENELYDAAYMTEHTIANYLTSVFDGELVKDGQGNYLVWDLEATGPVSVAPARGEIAAARPAFTGSYEVDGVSCTPAFELLKRHAARYTPEYVEHICGVPPTDLLKLSHMYATTKPSFIVGALGLRYQNAGETYSSFYILGALTGNIGAESGGVTTALMPTCIPIMFNDKEICYPDGQENAKHLMVKQEEFVRQCRTGEPVPMKAFIKTSGNPVHNAPTRSFWLETFEKADLVVDFDIWYTDTGELADYLLPDCMPFERYDILNSADYNHVVLQEPAIEPQGEARDCTYLYTELAKRLGFGEYFDKTTEEWLAVMLDTDYPLVKFLDPPLTYERLKKEKCVRTLAPAEPLDNTNGMQFGTPTGRMEFYIPRLRPYGREIATYVEPLEVPTTDTPNEKYPYQFFSGRQRFFMQSMFTDDPVMCELSGGKPCARMNPIDAKREGLRDNDKIEVYNQRGHVIVPLRLDEAMPPGTVHVWFGWRRRQFEKGTYAELIPTVGAPETINDIAQYWWDEQTQFMKPEPQPAGGATMAVGAWDTLWDTACAVRKYEEQKEVTNG